ncbi:carboxymuconolactone decarboxylase family protein [Ramlibacter sp.]|uniref:carboxymuconolactone decarboxylase family protein n=1 Tax=Ramlibacter sp. TaxID=1917967 RepID=UPI0017BF78FF|nr:carboxymuconolactone decarboxylase family protein [Ramlibacter sp.]MBA2676370.1 carboxymuconolactone decarboxylase family protein [Ramlibacter sp.]
MSQKARINFYAAAPKVADAMVQFSKNVGVSLGLRLKELVQLRVSQINGCAFCIDMHWAALVKDGMEPRHINAVAGWREAGRFFGERERAALNWAEAVNAVPHRSPSDADFEEARRHFSEAELVDLTFVVGAIRAWNMLNASLHTQVPAVPFTGE